jgi:hypothetical protein
LQRKAHNRLGFKGIQEIKEHPWLMEVNWKQLFEKKITSPFVPRGGDNFDRRYCEGIDKLDTETIDRYQGYLKKENFTSLFQNYTFHGDLIEKEQNRLKSALRKPSGKGIESYLTKSSSRSSIGSAVGQKKTLILYKENASNLVNNNVSNHSGTGANTSQAKIYSHSPIPGNNQGYQRTPILKSNKGSVKSLLNSVNVMKFYSNTPDKYIQSKNVSIDNKLPNIVDSKSKAPIEGSNSPFKNTVLRKTNRNITSSIETGSTNNTLNMHKRTLSNFTKKGIIK